MSIRKIMRRNKQILNQNKLYKQAKAANVRTFLVQDSLQMLSQPSLYFPVISKPDLKQNIIKIKNVAAFKKAAYLTDVQLQEFYSFFVINKKLKNNYWFHDDYGNPQDFDFYINPAIKKYQSTLQPIVQYCHSFPFMKSLVDRSNIILVNYSKIVKLGQENAAPKLQDVQQNLSGFKSHVFQHCMDHIQGKHFFTPSVSKGRITLQFNPQYFKDTRFLIGEYNIRVKKALDQNKQKNQQFIKTQKDYVDRIRKKYLAQAGPAKQWSMKTKF